MNSYSTAQKLSWAAHRVTTRVEDIAYSVLGLFEVNMSLLYGEGEKAFSRLQEEIIKRQSDHSIFAWRAPTIPGLQGGGLLATSPADVCDSTNIVVAPSMRPTQWYRHFGVTNTGLSISLPIIRDRGAILGVLTTGFGTSPIAGLR